MGEDKNTNKPNSNLDSLTTEEKFWAIGEPGRMPGRFSDQAKIITRDLNNDYVKPSFFRYNKDMIQKYLANPYAYEKQLRHAVNYIYGASCHFRRLIQYFVGLSDLSYYVSPYNIDPKTANTRTFNINYRKVLKVLSSMSIKTQFPKILTVVLREDMFCGTMWESDDSITIQQLPNGWCKIASIEDKVLNVSFNFAYFDSRPQMLDYYPPEFREKYDNVYKKNRRNRWIEPDAPTSFCVKCNTDELNYAMPPFSGLLREIYELEDYKTLKLSKATLENYAMLVMNLPMSDDGEWGIDLSKAREFWRNLDAIMPEEVGSILSPMSIDKISFEKSNTGDTDTISEAEQHLYTTAGVSSLLFNNENASSNALLLSIKADQAITYGIVKSIQDVINRYIQSQRYGRNCKINFMDVSPYNRKEVGDAYLKAASYGLPTISMYAASQGLDQAELDAMSFLEGRVLGLQDIFRPIQSSSQMSSDDLEGGGATDEGGAPAKDIGELSDSGEQSVEQKEDWG